MIRLKIRSPSGTHVINLNNDATVGDLLSEIRAQNSADASTDIEIKYGYPPKPLRLDHHPASTRLANLPVPLQGEQLIIALKDGRRVDNPKDMNLETELSERKSFSFISGSKSNYNNQSNSVPSSAPLSLSRHAAPKLNKDDPPDVTLKSGRGKVVLRVMEDDNSCLFRALSYVMTRSMMSSEELRQLVAGTILENPNKYSEAVLEKTPEKYCEWIKMESSWGGGIELGILAQFFETEICTVDVATGNMIKFNEGKQHRVVVVYSGIHYDSLALSPVGSLVNDSVNDEVVFGSNDDEILGAAVELCKKLKQQKYFTDTKTFTLRCGVCKTGFKGQKAAIQHAHETGHTDFGEY